MFEATLKVEETYHKSRCYTPINIQSKISYLTQIIDLPINLPEDVKIDSDGYIQDLSLFITFNTFDSMGHGFCNCGLTKTLIKIKKLIT